MDPKTQDLLDAYRRAPAHMQDYLQLVAHIGAGKPLGAEMRLLLKMLADLIVGEIRPARPAPFAQCQCKKGGAA